MDETREAGAAVEQWQQIVTEAFADAPMLYANGFLNGLGVGDTFVVLQANGRSVAVVNLSLSVAKTLGQNLVEMVRSYEEATGQEVLSLDELQERSSSTRG